MTFQPASRKSTFALIGLTGHSGTGKTYSALRLAKGLSTDGRVALIDTENGRGSMYSDDFTYDVQELHAPFTPQRYTELIEEAAAEKFSVGIIDSFSHEWESIGGVLEMADNQKTNRGDDLKGLAKWMKPKSLHKRMLNILLQVPMHWIICMRGKDKLIQTKDQRGREVIVNAGVIPIQEGRLIYEMTLSLILDEHHKCRYGKPIKALYDVFDGKMITEESGRAVRDWLAGGSVVDAATEQVRKQAREKASEGTASFREWWPSLSKQQQAALKPIVDECQKAAKAADDALGLTDLPADKTTEQPAEPPKPRNGQMFDDEPSRGNY